MVNTYQMTCVDYSDLEYEYCRKYGEYPDINVVFGDALPAREHYSIIPGWCGDEDSERAEVIRRLFDLAGVNPVNDMLAWVEY